MMSLTDEKLTMKFSMEEAKKTKTAEPYTWSQIIQNIVWPHVIILMFFHIGFILSLIIYSFGLYSVPINRWTVVWLLATCPTSAIGVTAGAHRLWGHRAYKANLRLRILLMLIYSAVGMNSIFAWVRDHRVHHKYSETDADPHNASRGFFFAHVGWLILERHPEYLRQAREIDMTDILADPVVTFNKKYFTQLKLILCFAIPTAVPIIFWGETIPHAVMTQCFIRYLIPLHVVWSVNSVAHLWGERPYNRLINPAENLIVSFFAAGEGSHNYHHTFPWDYKTSELPYKNFNWTTAFIDAMAKLGWAYDRRKATPEFVNDVIQRFGAI